jgi:hypothetical protein
MRGAFLADLTWPEAGARIAAGAVVVVPVGAPPARGDPSLATCETGEASLEEITRELVDGLLALYPDLR